MRAVLRTQARLASKCLRDRISVNYGLFGARWSSSLGRQWSTPLAKSLAEAITTTGPVSVAAYMRQCLTSPDGGYYTSKPDGRDQFGRKGDFVTSPEISQVFGELVGIWVVAEWIAQGRKREGVQLMEVGPGRGTLMDDMLRTIRNFKSMASAIEAIYLVEASPSLREAQQKLLCGDAPMEAIDIGHQSTCKYLPGTKIIWCEDIRFIPKDPTKTPFIIAHEFFDALPIHVFQSVLAPAPSSPKSTLTRSTTPTPSHPPSATNIPQWRELLVSPKLPDPIKTIAESTPSSSSTDDPTPEFELTLAPHPTPHSLYLPTLSLRYQALLSQPPGSIIEISPESLAIVSDFATRIGGSSSSSNSNKSSSRTPPAPGILKPHPSGAALILDYGPASTVPTNSLRGILAHRRVSPFALPGRVDLSADVDFQALAEAALRASEGVEVHGPVAQADFLETMGGRERVRALVKQAGAGADPEVRQRIEGGWRRLVDRGPLGMGGLYRALAIVPFVPEREVRRPVGFGGDVRGL